MRRPVHWVGRSINAILAHGGLAVRRLPQHPGPVDLVVSNEPPPARVDLSFYPSVPSCQVPNLGFLFELFLGRRDLGSFVEVGAYDGVTFSNTWGLAQRGWAGLLIEPVPELAEMSLANHRHHPQVRIVESAVGRRGDSEVRLFLAGSLTSTSAEQMIEYEAVAWARSSLTTQTITVRSQPLDELLRAAGFTPDFDLLVVDVEGGEQAVFSGFDLTEWRPRMMIIELADTHPDLRMSRAPDHLLGRRLADSGYEVAYKDSINTVFVRTDVADAAYVPDGDRSESARDEIVATAATRAS